MAELEKKIVAIVQAVKKKKTAAQERWQQKQKILIFWNYMLQQFEIFSISNESSHAKDVDSIRQKSVAHD